MLKDDKGTMKYVTIVFSLNVHSTVDLHVAMAKMSSRNVMLLLFFLEKKNMQGVVGEYQSLLCLSANCNGDVLQCNS